MMKRNPKLAKRVKTAVQKARRSPYSWDTPPARQHPGDYKAISRTR